MQSFSGKCFGWMKRKRSFHSVLWLLSLHFENRFSPSSTVIRFFKIYVSIDFLQNLSFFHSIKNQIVVSTLEKMERSWWWWFKSMEFAQRFVCNIISQFVVVIVDVLVASFMNAATFRKHRCHPRRFCLNIFFSPALYYYVFSRIVKKSRLRQP